MRKYLTGSASAVGGFFNVCMDVRARVREKKRDNAYGCRLAEERRSSLAAMTAACLGPARKFPELPPSTAGQP